MMSIYAAIALSVIVVFVLITILLFVCIDRSSVVDYPQGQQLNVVKNKLASLQSDQLRSYRKQHRKHISKLKRDYTTYGRLWCTQEFFAKMQSLSLISKGRSDKYGFVLEANMAKFLIQLVFFYPTKASFSSFYCCIYYPIVYRKDVWRTVLGIDEVNLLQNDQNKRRALAQAIFRVEPPVKPPKLSKPPLPKMRPSSNDEMNQTPPHFKLSSTLTHLPFPRETPGPGRHRLSEFTESGEFTEFGEPTESVEFTEFYSPQQSPRAHPTRKSGADTSRGNTSSSSSPRSRASGVSNGFAPSPTGVPLPPAGAQLTALSRAADVIRGNRGSWGSEGEGDSAVAHIRNDYQHRELISEDLERSRFAELTRNPEKVRRLDLLLRDWLDDNPCQEYVQGVLALASLIVMVEEDRVVAQEMLNILRQIMDRYFASLSVRHREAYALSRLFMHRALLRFFSPSLFESLQGLQLEASLYAWDWFYQLFLGIFPFHQSLLLLDLLFSVCDSDYFLVCLSVALLDELRPIILHSSFERILRILKEMDKNIPYVDFPHCIETTLLLYRNAPQSFQREFSRIDAKIDHGEIDFNFDFENYSMLLDLSPGELAAFKEVDEENMVVVDLCNSVQTKTRELMGLQKAVVYNMDVTILINEEYNERQKETFASFLQHKYRLFILLISPNAFEENAYKLLQLFENNGFYRVFLYKIVSV